VANTAAICDVFRSALLCGTHAFGAQGANGTRTVTTKDVFKAALFLASATIDRSTTVYSTTGELAGTGNYTQGGVTVTNATAPANTGGTGIVAFWTPSAAFSWSALTSSGAFDAVLLYNSSNTAGAAVAVFTFGSQSVTAGNFTLTMPTNDLSTGLIRLS
jgi:hypothetical protein